MPPKRKKAAGIETGVELTKVIQLFGMTKVESIRQANPILDRRPALDYARLAAQASGVNSAIF